MPLEDFLAALDCNGVVADMAREALEPVRCAMRQNAQLRSLLHQLRQERGKLHDGADAQANSQKKVAEWVAAACSGSTAASSSWLSSACKVLQLVSSIHKVGNFIDTADLLSGRTVSFDFGPTPSEEHAEGSHTLEGTDVLKFPMAHADEAEWADLREAVRATEKEVSSRLLQELNTQALKLAVKDDGKENCDWDELLDGLFNAVHLKAQAATVWGQVQSRGDVVLLWAEFPTLLGKLRAALDAEGHEQVTLEVGHAFNPRSSEVSVSMDAYMTQTKLFSHLLTAAAGLECLRTSYIKAGPERTIHGNAVREDVCLLLKVIEESQQSAERLVDSDVYVGTEIWRDTAQATKSWLQRATTGLAEGRVNVFRILVRSLDKCAEEAVSLTPQFSHVLTETRFLRSGVRKTLLENGRKQELSDCTVRMHRLLGSVRATYTQLRIGGAADDVSSDTRFREAWSTAHSSYLLARRAVTVTAGASICDTGNTAQSREAAQRFLSANHAEIPEALLAELRKLAGEPARRARAAPAVAAAA